MTENEAIEKIRAYSKCLARQVKGIYEDCNNKRCDDCDLCYMQGTTGEHRKTIDIAIQALEEVQQYRAIGTQEECRKSLEICKAMVERNITPDDMENYMKFEDECIKQGFTLVGLLKAGEKHEAMEPIRMDKCTCPSCGTHNEVWKKRRNTLPSDIVYCWHCGQAVEIKRSDK